MNTATHPRRILKTGRPLGLLDVFAKIADNASLAVKSRVGALFARPVTDRGTQLAREAAVVRRMADQQRNSSPEFASELYAAADRHELIG